MSKKLWDAIATRVDEHKYMTGVERAVERVRATGEVFTPTALVVEMLQYCGPELFAPGKTVLDPACGDGQFLVAVKWVKVLFHHMPESGAVADLFGVDVMRDNVDLCRRRLGGGTILMGDTLAPRRRLEGQSEEEHRLMQQLFDHEPERAATVRRRRAAAGSEAATLF